MEILIRYGADRERIGRHGVTIFCVLCVKIECRAILGDDKQSMGNGDGGSLPAISWLLPAISRIFEFTPT